MKDIIKKGHKAAAMAVVYRVMDWRSGCCVSVGTFYEIIPENGAWAVISRWLSFMLLSA